MEERRYWRGIEIVWDSTTFHVHTLIYWDLIKSAKCVERKENPRGKARFERHEAFCGDESNHYCLQKLNEAIKSDIELWVTKKGSFIELQWWWLEYAKWRINQGIFPWSRWSMSSPFLHDDWWPGSEMTDGDRNPNPPSSWLCPALSLGAGASFPGSGSDSRAQSATGGRPESWQKVGNKWWTICRGIIET